MFLFGLVNESCMLWINILGCLASKFLGTRGTTRVQPRRFVVNLIVLSESWHMSYRVYSGSQAERLIFLCAVECHNSSIDFGVADNDLILFIVLGNRSFREFCGWVSYLFKSCSRLTLCRLWSAETQIHWPTLIGSRGERNPMPSGSEASDLTWINLHRDLSPSPSPPSLSVTL